MEERVILVDEQDREIGTEEKLRAHLSGVLHRAFSVFVFDHAGNMLLQQRARTKYHSGGLWANTCCGHPRPGEAIQAAARRRLREEMGIDCPLRPSTTFLYRADVGSGLIEHEYDHIFVARYDGEPVPAREEVEAWQWSDPEEIARDVTTNAGRYAAWFPIALAEVRAHEPGRGLVDASTRR
ncbi:MAG: isopentenyl-diphosphate Delta-isomerase [Gemmatimonadaceae bacterium]